MGSSGDNPANEDTSDETLPDEGALTDSVRGEIAHFFGAAIRASARPRKGHGGFGRLLADIEERVLAGIREPEAPPARIGPFLLDQQIGRGAFAVVYRATHARTRARAAVKLVPASDPESHHRIQIEVESLIHVRHPNIVRVIDTGEDEGFAWIATEYIEGQTLAEFTRSTKQTPDSFHIGEDAERAPTPPSGPDPKPRAVDRESLRLRLSWFRDLAGALDALHQTGLVHRDVKPANILLDAKQRPYLIDFGLSSSAEGTVNGLLAGTVPYMSPEQTLGGYVAITPRSDVYSLAATFHEVLTGLRVTHGARREAILHEIAFVQVPPPSRVAAGIPDTLDPIFSRALAKDPNQRYASAKLLEEDLDDWLAGSKLRHATESRRSRLGRFFRRHAAAVAIAAFLAIAALGWGVASHVTANQQYEAAVFRIRTALDSGDFRAALAMLAGDQARYGDRRDYAEIYREAVIVGAEPLALGMVEEQAFAAAGLARESSHSRLASEARAHLAATGRPEEHLILVVAVSEFLSSRPDEALATLARYRSIVDRTRFLSEFEAVVALHLKRRADYDAIATRLAGLPPAKATPLDACTRAWRILTCKQRYPDAAVAADEVKQVTDDLERCLKSKEHAFARAMLTLLAIDRGDWREARFQVEELTKLHASAADEVMTQVMRAVIWMVLAGQTSGKEREGLMTSGASFAKSALETDPGFSRWVVAYLQKADLSVKVTWMKTALDEQWTKRPPLDRHTLAFAVGTMYELARRQDADQVLEIANGVERQPAFQRSVGDAEQVRYERLHLATLRAVRTAHARAGRVEEARQAASRARACVARFRAAGARIPYPLGVEDALAAAYAARTETDAASRRERILTAAADLRAIEDDGVVEAARKDFPEQKEREDFAKLRRLCADELGLLAGFIDEGRAESR